MTHTRWWWVRHAPVTETNGRIYGATDPRADTSDEPSFNALHAMLPDRARWVTSHLRRTKQTAAAIAEAGRTRGRAAGGAQLRRTGLRGLARHELQRAHEHADRAPLLAGAGELCRRPNGESFACLCARTAPAIRRLTSEWAGRDIVGRPPHGGTIRAALGLALGLDPETRAELRDGQPLADAHRSPRGDGPGTRKAGASSTSTDRPTPADGVAPEAGGSSCSPPAPPGGGRSGAPNRRHGNLRARRVCASPADPVPTFGFAIDPPARRARPVRGAGGGVQRTSPLSRSMTALTPRKVRLRGVLSRRGAARYAEHWTVERLKGSFGDRHVSALGHRKVFAHAMFRITPVGGQSFSGRHTGLPVRFLRRHCRHICPRTGRTSVPTAWRRNTVCG